MTYTAIDCQSFAGAFTLGMVQSGFELVGKREHPGGFGVPAVEANRALLGNNWKTELGTSDDGWTPIPVDVVFGNPPCSGFSVASNREFRGAQSKINHCMWDLVKYAAKCDPTVVAFESVAPAFTRPDGHELMLQLRAELERLTDDQWNLTHLKHNAYALGGVAMRPRYFWVASRTALNAFMVDPTPLDRYHRPMLNDAISDLVDLPLDWEPQPYGSAEIPAHVTRRKLRPQGLALVDGMMTHRPDSLDATRIQTLLDTEEWGPGEVSEDVMRRIIERGDKIPEPWTERNIAQMEKRGWQSGFFPKIRWPGDKPGRVITGAGLSNTIHPTLNRLITHREVARIMGFPDDWTCLPWAAAERGSDAFWGKGITVQCGSWLGAQIKANLNDEPLGAHTGTLIGDREWVIDIKPSKEKL